MLSDDNSKFDRLALGWFIVVVTQQAREQTHKQDASWSLTVLRNVTYRLAKHQVANTEQSLAPQAQPVCVIKLHITTQNTLLPFKPFGFAVSLS